VTYIQLIQRLWQEAGASGTSPGPTTVTGATGETLRLANWIAEAWMEIQRKHRDWGWMRSSASFTTVAGQMQYPLGSGAGTVGVTAATHGMWAVGTGRSYVTATGNTSEAFVDPIDYDVWRDHWNFGGFRSSRARPYEVAVAPDKSLCLGPNVDSIYTVTHDYFTAPVALSADADTPSMPDRFHMAIVWRALMEYGSYENAPEAYDRGEKNFKSLMRELEADRLPQMQWAGALA
jgi:hypothetical protein